MVELSKLDPANEDYDKIVENRFQNPLISPLSTFSVDVDRASYSNVRRFVNMDMLPPTNAVRIEELINYFHYDYPEPKRNRPFSINLEAGDCPWNQNTKLVRIGLMGKTLKPDQVPKSNLVFLIDVSGSMGEPNKLPLVKKSLNILVNNLQEDDNVSIVVYAGAAGCVLEPTSGKNKEDILAAISNLSAGGSTAGGEGIKTGL
jgi:Ca-activated chloride channel family protein